MNAVVWGIGLYILAQLSVGFLVSRFIRSEEDYAGDSATAVCS